MPNRNLDKVTITMTVREAETVRLALIEHRKVMSKSYYNGGGLFGRGEAVRADIVTMIINMALSDPSRRVQPVPENMMEDRNA